MVVVVVVAAAVVEKECGSAPIEVRVLAEKLAAAAMAAVTAAAAAVLGAEKVAVAVGGTRLATVEQTEVVVDVAACKPATGVKVGLLVVAVGVAVGVLAG